MKIPPRIFYLSCALLLFAVDQITKHLAIAALAGREAMVLTPFLNFILVFNPGAAFGFLSDAGGWQMFLFSAVAVAVSALVIFLLWRTSPGQPARASALCLILGGAVGNLSDRILLGAVVDFVDFHYAGFHWPAFNVADAAISIGAFLLVFTLLSERAR